MTVVAAILFRAGKVLACRRRPDQEHPGKWEFPGGKLEPGEGSQQALVRELREELGIEACIEAEITRYEFAYPGRRPIRLIFHRVTEFEGDPDFSQFADARWVEPTGLAALDFLEGDEEFVRRLAAGETG